MTDNLIEMRDVCLQRGERVVFDQVNLAIPRGSVTAIMGPSGCGKTTLLRLIGGQLRATRGTVTVDGQNVGRLDRQQLFALRRRMGMLFQSGALFTDLNVFDNVAFPLRVHTGLPESMIRDLVLMKLDAVGLRGARQLMPSELSGGMARRAALARAIILDPDLIIYDEPFAGQDPISMGMLATLIAQLNKALGVTTVIVSHDVAETAAIADYLYVLAEGRIRGHGATATVMDSEDARVRQFIHGLPDGPVPFHYPAMAYFQDLGLEPSP
ncbi:MAG: ATP-binding cassette domain-containing protein [Alcanivorax sp.]|nr:ATP-binding cassette domain-containing protein [Alcanivorax sp.]